MKKTLLSDLRWFTGSETFYRHSLSRKYIYTQGVKYLADKAGAYWLIDQIALGRPASLEKEDFQVCKLLVNSGTHTATLTTEDGNDNILSTTRIDYTDFPLPEIELWVECNEVGGFTILLPSEH